MTVLYFYITIFSIYYIILALISIKPEKKIRDKYTSKDSNLCVVVYATGNVDTLENLIKQLKNQTYPSERYTIYTVLDKCENVPEVLLQTDLDINVVNINNIEPIGKSQAYSILAEKLSEAKNLDAFVFLDSKNYVDNDFLANINFYLTKADVLMPMINYIEHPSGLSFAENIKAAYSRYLYRFIYASRARLKLTNLLNTNAFIIKKSVLEEMGSFDFKDKVSEVRYTLNLAKEGFKVLFNTDMKVYTDIQNFELRIPSLTGRLGIIKDNWLKCKNFISFEYLCSLIAPNVITCILVYILLLMHSYKFPFVASYSSILITASLLVLAFCISLFNANMYAKEHIFLFSYPLLSIHHVITNFPPIRAIKNFIKNRNRKHNIEKMVTDIIVTDGVKDFPCKLELISDDGLVKVKFINNKKSYTTKNNHLRMVDAIKELTQKMDDYGLSIKICQTCKYFQPIVDGTTNMVKGVCECQFEGRLEGDIIPTLIWNTCPRYEKQNIVNLF